MIAEQVGGQADRFLRRDRAVGPDFENELVVVGHLADARPFHVIVHAADRRMNGVDGNVAQRQIAVRIAIGDLVAAAALETRLELERAFLRQRGQVRRRVEDLDVRVLLEVGRGDDARSLLLEVERLGPFTVQLEGDLFEVEDDVGHILDDAGERRELVQHALDADSRDRGALDGGEEHASQRIADRGAEAALEGLGGEAPVVRREGLGIVFELLGFLKI